VTKATNRRGGFQTRPPVDPYASPTARFPNRRSLRLKKYDYSTPGAYFVTACTHNRKCIFGTIQDHQVALSPAGRIVENSWHELREHYRGLELDVFVTMPNHVHGIVFLADGAPTLSEIIRGFKTYSARHANALRDTAGQPVWQRGFHDHIIRNEKTLSMVREYIVNNPAKWHHDRENPDAVRAGLETRPYEQGPFPDAG